MKASPSNNYQYNKRLLRYARELRQDMTKAEVCLWKHVLRAGKMKGFTFRRQRPVLKYIADFMCKELFLIIEVDGITHTFEEVIKKDKKRQTELEDAGFDVIRFTDDEVLNHIDSVHSVLEQKVVEIMNKSGVTPRIRKRDRNK